MHKKIFSLGSLALATLLLIFFLSTTFTLRHLRKAQDLTNSYVPSPPTLETIFSSGPPVTAPLPAHRLRSIIATGDIIPARSVNTGVLRRNNPLWPYEKVKDWFWKQNADIVFINLETPLLDTCPPTDEGMIFCGTSRNIEGLKEIKTTIANLANNHQGNHGKEGIEETKAHLKKAGIAYTGTDTYTPTFLTVRDLTFAFLGFNDIGNEEEGLAWAHDARIQKAIREAKKQADIVIVTYHFGAEYQSQPDERQIVLAHLTIDAGADVVIGNHPHWIQPVEIYKGKLITYAHGNFVFDQMWSQKTREGVVGKYTFYDTTLIDVSFFPVQIEDYGQPFFLEGARRDEVLKDMREQSVLRAQQTN